MGRRSSCVSSTIIGASDPTADRSSRGTRRGRIHVQIRDGFLPQLGCELLSPLGRTRERHLFAVPAAEDERAARPRALLLELAQRLGELHHRRRAARPDRPRRTPTHRDGCRAPPTHPADSLPRMRAFDDVVRLHVGAHVDLRGAERAASRRVDTRSADAPFHSGGAAGPPSFSRMGWMSRCDIGSAMTFGTDTASAIGIRRAPAVDAQPGVSGSPGTMKSYAIPPRWMWLAGPHGPFGNTSPLHIAVLLRIRIDDHRRRAFALGGQRLESAVAVRVRVADDDDLPFRIDAVLAEHVVVGRIAAVGVDHRRGDVARGGERQPRTADVALRRIGDPP